MLESCTSSIKSGISFLSKNQLSSGEFATMISPKPDMKNSIYVKSPFFTALILHSLSHLNKSEDLNGITRKATNFLLQERDDTGYWRFFGKESGIPPDLDDTCCALSALYIYGVELDFETISESLLRYRDNKGIFNTWVLDLYSADGKDNYVNYIDWVVNANILFFYSLLKTPLPEIVDYLCHIIKERMFIDGSKYYNSPFSFLYCVTRIYAYSNTKDFQSIKTILKGYLLNTQNNNGGWGNSLEDAMATVSLINLGVKGKSLEKAINNLLSLQESDGGWPIAPFSLYIYPKEKEFYGSRELNTVIALEALRKYYTKALCHQTLTHNFTIQQPKYQQP